MAGEENKRIAKNTMLLYVRTLLMMFVSLYTSRIVLNTLGETDFGIYNLVAGVIVLFTFLNNALSSATQRYLTFELGRNDTEAVKRVFSMSMTVHFSIAILLIILAETIGLWFLNNELNIPHERMFAANWAYQLSLLACCVQLLRIPYNAIIIAYEKMSFFAYISLLEAFLKLGLVFMLVWMAYDKLIIYAGLMLFSAVCITWFYKKHCCKYFNSSHYNFFWDASLYKELMRFSGWSLLGTSADIGASKVVNIIINIFSGVVANTAAGISLQVCSAVNALVLNFQTAFKPQIIKNYATSSFQQLYALIFSSSKISFYLLFLFCLPIFLNTDFILHIWLGQTPLYAIEFTQWTLCCLLIDAISAPLWMSAQATGRIKGYQILVSACLLSNLPMAYGLMTLDFSPTHVFMCKAAINLLTHFARLVYLRKLIHLSVREFTTQVMARILGVVALSAPLPFYLSVHFERWQKLLLTTGVSSAMILITVYLIGLTKSERIFIKHTIKNKLHNNTCKQSY